MAQHARPNVNGQRELERAHLTSWSSFPMRKLPPSVTSLWISRSTWSGRVLPASGGSLSSGRFMSGQYPRAWAPTSAMLFLPSPDPVQRALLERVQPADKEESDEDRHLDD